MTSGADGMHEELRGLSRGRGAPGSDLAARLGGWLPGDRAQVEAALRGSIDDLPPDLRLVALGALGLDPEFDDRFLAGRVARLATRLQRDDRTVRRWMDEAFRLLAERAHRLVASEPALLAAAPGRTFEVPAGRLTALLTVDVCPIELLTDVDVLVASGNIHLEQPQTYKSSVSAALRRAAAVHGPAGEIVDDVLARELSGWIAANGRPGLPVAPGTVISLGPGELRTRGARRIFYAALATVRPGTNDYDIAPDTIARTIAGVFAAARADPVDPPLRSLALPVLGAGRGGLPIEVSLSWIRTALERELPVGGPWHVHIATRRPALVPVIIDGLLGFAAAS